MGSEAEAVGPWKSVWGTWEKLVLAGAILRHGTHDWNVVASELRTRTRTPNPSTFTPEACKTKYEDVRKRYSSCTAWFEELRKKRVAELKRDLARSEDSIGSLESKIKSLEAGKGDSNSSHTESPLPRLNSDGNDSFAKAMIKDEQSSGSLTEDTRTRKCTSVSFEQDKDLNVKTLLETSRYGQVVTTKKRRGLRKRKDCNVAPKEGSACGSENLGSSNVASTMRKDNSTNNCAVTTEDYGTVNTNRNSPYTLRRDDNLMEIFKSISQTETTGVFKHRMDSQKRARYRKIIKQHLDFGTIRSRITGQSIQSSKELFRDLLLLANNALVFYSRKTREYKSALSLQNLVMKEYKQHCRGTCHEAMSSFVPCNRPVKPRSARPRPRLPPCKDEVSEKFSKAENVKEEALKKPCGSDNNVPPHSSLKGKKGLKRPGKVQSELVDIEPRTSPLKLRKRVRK